MKALFPLDQRSDEVVEEREAEDEGGLTGYQRRQERFDSRIDVVHGLK